MLIIARHCIVYSSILHRIDKDILVKTSHRQTLLYYRCKLLMYVTGKVSHVLCMGWSHVISHLKVRFNNSGTWLVFYSRISCHFVNKRLRHVKLIYATDFFHENVSHYSNLKTKYDYRVIILPHILFLDIQLSVKNIKIKHMYSYFFV